VDAKVGNKLLDANLLTHQTGGLPPVNTTGSLNPQYGSKLSGEYQKPVFPTSRTPVTGTLGSTQFNSAPLSAPLSRDSKSDRPPTGRINREQSSPLKKMEIDDDLISKLRN